VVVEFVLAGTQQGEFLGIAPTGKTVTTLVLISYRFTEGRALPEILVLADFVTVLRQLDVLPCCNRPAAWFRVRHQHAANGRRAAGHEPSSIKRR
jgi:SnoaL-like polyketide cyclase